MGEKWEEKANNFILMTRRGLIVIFIFMTDMG